MGIFTDGFTAALGIMPPIAGLGDAAAEVSAITGPAGAVLMSIPGPTQIVGAALQIIPGIVSAFEKDPYERQILPVLRNLAMSHGVPALAEWFGVFQGSDERGNPITLGTETQVANLVTDATQNDAFMQQAADGLGQSLILIGNEAGTIWRRFDPQSSSGVLTSGNISPLLLVGLALGALLLFK
jgi:hypothetical protein